MSAQWLYHQGGAEGQSTEHFLFALLVSLL
jgi:hypothetical protein